MLRSALSKVAWVGRTASMVFGLAVVLALLFGVAATALAGTGVGATFNLGQVNSVNKISSLIGSASSAMLKLDNNGAGPALALQVEPGKQPMTVNRSTKVTNLNADKVDGKDAPLWAVIRDNGTTARGFGVTSSQNLGSPGEYEVVFNRDVRSCAYIASLGDETTSTRYGEVSAVQRLNKPNGVFVQTLNSGGGKADAAFHLAVFC